MSFQPIWRRAGKVLASICCTLLLQGCLLSPGSFASAIDLRRDGSFSFSYKGEIHMLALSKLAQKDAGEEQPFWPETCYDDEGNERECTAAELEQQQANWAVAQEERKASHAREADSMKAFFGGIDPANPEAAEELAERLRRQRGWNSVEYKGEGLFVVDYAIAGRIDHDFVFPVIERFPTANAFVSATVRSGNQVRIEAPAFSAASTTGNPMAGMMGMAAQEGEDMPKLPELNGSFTLTTDGAILANNTEEGPVEIAGGLSRLAWQVNARSGPSPTALVRLGD